MALLHSHQANQCLCTSAKQASGVRNKSRACKCALFDVVQLLQELSMIYVPRLIFKTPSFRALKGEAMPLSVF